MSCVWIIDFHGTMHRFDRFVQAEWVGKNVVAKYWECDELVATQFIDYEWQAAIELSCVGRRH